MRILYPGLISAVLLFTSPLIFAQTAENHLNRFSLGASAGLVQDQWNLNAAESHGDGVTTSSNGNLSYVVNVNGAYAFGKHWRLKLSPEVQSRSFDYRIDGLHFGEDFDGLGFGDGSHIIYDVKAVALRVPVTVEYIFGAKKILPFISLGLAGEFILKQSADGTVYYRDGTTDQLGGGDFLRKSNVAAVAGAGIYYRVTSRISLSISPVFSYSLLDDPEKQYQYSFGAMAGVSLNLGK